MKKILSTLTILTLVSAANFLPAAEAVKLSKAETAEGFRPLFNGKDTTGWKLRRRASHGTRRRRRNQVHDRAN